MAPQVEPFTDYPPGYALYLLPFLAVLKDPFIAAAVAQGVSIIAFLAALYVLLRILRWHPILRISAFAFVTVFATFPLIYRHYWTEPLFLACTLAVVACVLRADPERGMNGWWRAALFAFLGSSLKFIGVFNLIWFIVPLSDGGRHRAKKTLIGLLACTLPVLLWFTRNMVRYGRISFSHLLGEHELKHTLLRPFNFLVYDALNINGSVWFSLLVLLIIGFFLFRPLLRKGTPLTSSIASTHGLLVIASLSHAIGIWILSLVTYFSLLDDRLLAPSITLGMLAVLNGINEMKPRISRYMGYALLVLPAAFLFSARHTTRPDLPDRNGSFQQPPEANAWREFRATDAFAGATHFYSDRDFRHQLFARIPQRILWDADEMDERMVETLLLRGERPFFVFHLTSTELGPFERSLRQANVHLVRRTYDDAGLVFYSVQNDR